MPIVVMPDGVEVELPDNPTPQQRAEIDSLLSSVPEKPNLLARAGASLATGAAKGWSGLLNLKKATTPQDLRSPETGTGLSPMGERVQKILTDFASKMDKYGIENPYGRAALEAIGGGAAFGGVSPTAVVSSGMSGIGSEAATRVFGDNPVSRFLGGLAGGAAGAMGATKIANVRPQSGAIAREAMEGITDDMLAAAQKVQADALQRGVQMDLAQALKSVGAPTGNIETLRNFLANRKQGNQVQASLQAQPNQLHREAQRTVDAMPGSNFGEAQSANNLQEAATGAVNAAKQQRSEAVRALYAKAGELPPEARKQLAATVDTFLKQPGLSEDVKQAALDFTRKLSGRSQDLDQAVEAARAALAAAKSPSERAAAQAALAKANSAANTAGTKPLSALDVDTWLGELTGPFKGTPLSPAKPKSAGQIKYLGGLLNKEFQKLSPEVAAAEKEFARLSDELVNPLKQSVVGNFATPRGYKPDVEASQRKLTALLDRGVDVNASSSDVLKLGKELYKVDKTAFQDALKSHLSMKLEGVAKPGGISAAEATNADMAVKIADALWKSKSQAQGLRDAVSLIAKQNGQDPVEAVRGLNRLIQMTDALRSRPQSIGGLRSNDLFELGSKTYGADALRVFGFLPFERAARKLEDAVLSKTLSQFDQILTSPEGAQMLSKLAKLPPGNRSALIFLANFGAQSQNAAEPQADSGQ